MLRSRAVIIESSSSAGWRDDLAEVDRRDVNPSLDQSRGPLVTGRTMRLSAMGGDGYKTADDGVEYMVGGHAALCTAVRSSQLAVARPMVSRARSRIRAARAGWRGSLYRGNRCARRPGQPPGRSRPTGRIQRVVPARPKPRVPSGAAAARTAWRPSQACRPTRRAVNRRPGDARPGRYHDASGWTGRHFRPQVELIMSPNGLNERPRPAERSVKCRPRRPGAQLLRDGRHQPPLRVPHRSSVVGTGHEKHRPSGRGARRQVDSEHPHRRV
jgi:hypothetical protein